MSRQGYVVRFTPLGDRLRHPATEPHLMARQHAEHALARRCCPAQAAHSAS